jgi:RNA polymerase sigma-70 factor (ECF subfamily)
MPDLRLVPPEPSAAAAPLAERSDDELMLLASAGARDAFGALVARRMQRLASFCARLSGDARTGEEIAQEAWLAVWAGRRAYQPEGKFGVYLYTVARNRCRNHVRDRGRRGRWSMASAPEPVIASADHLDALLVEERRRRVQEALGRLPEKFREPLVLRFSEELEYEDIARILGRSESTIRSRVHYGLQKLHRELRRASP